MKQPVSYETLIMDDEVAHTADTSVREIASARRCSRLVSTRLLQFLSVLLLALILPAFAWPHTAHAAPLNQSNPGTSPQLYLLPQDAANNNVIVDTHIAKLRIVEDAAGPLLQVNATYQLRNPAESGVTLPLMLFPGGDQTLGGFQNVSLTQDTQALLLQSTEGGGYLSQIGLDAGERTTIGLQYQSPLGNESLATFRYAPAILNGWAGNISLRVELEVPNSIPAESWLEIAPAEWRYSASSEAGTLGLRWLYDFSAPEDPLLLRFITPRVWSELRAAESAASENAAAAAFVRLGDFYRDLMGLAPNDGVRERFYAQAIAAYSGGVASPGFSLASPAERAALHVGLADLYRRRLVEAASSDQGGYADLMVSEIEQALVDLPADDARVTELRQWQVDGWQLQLNAALDREDWPAALTIVDDLAALPAEVIDPNLVAEDRRFILLQQALELMEQGNRVAAVAIAGDQIAADTLLPPAQAESLFSGWQLTLTVAPDAMQMVAFGLTHPERHGEALAALQEVVALWEKGTEGEGYQFAVEETPTEVSLQSGVRVQVDFPAGGNGFLLASLLPPRVDYALLRGLLTQLDPNIDHDTGVVWQRVEMRQPLNLAPVVNEWNGMAAGLEEQAAGFEAQSKAPDTGEAESAEAALTAQLQAVNYRSTAAEWRRLARQSSILLRFQVNDPVFTRLKGEPPVRSWTITAASPSQTFVFQTQVLSFSRILIGIAFAFMVLIAVAGVLWGLL